MIPILSSIIVGASKNENMTATRGFFLIFSLRFINEFAYTIAEGVIAGVFGANLQVVFTKSLCFGCVCFNICGFRFFQCSVILKLDFLNLFKTKLNKTTDGKRKQGIVGIAIMGFLSALIVGPCVAPPLAGALVYIGQTGDALLGGISFICNEFRNGNTILLIGLGAGRFMQNQVVGWKESQEYLELWC